MEKEKSGTAKSNWLSWIRDLVIVNIGVALFVVLVGLLPLWAQVLPIFIGFLIALSLCRERRVRRAFTLFAITWLIFATTIMIEDQGDVFFTYAVTGVLILLLMLGGLGFSFIISQPREHESRPDADLEKPSPAYNLERCGDNFFPYRDDLSGEPASRGTFTQL